MSECLSIPELEKLKNHAGSAEQITAWRRHLRVCDSCASALLSLQANGTDSGISGQDDLPRSKSGNHRYRISHLEPNTRIGDFQIEKRLGTGGMGVVYQALQLSLNRHVALKILQKGLSMSESSIQRFHREAQAAAKLHHTNIVGIHAEGEEDGVCYYAMDMIQGQSLDKVLARLRSMKSGQTDLPPSEGAEAPESSELSKDASTQKINLCQMHGKPQYFDIIAGLIADIADALDYAHQRGVIHLDVKPSNLILGDDGKLSLMDFGVARMCENTDLTMTGTFIGTVQYMSPEQLSLKRSQLDHHTDIYSLGATLYELLTLELPFNGDHREQLITQIMKSEPRKPRQIDGRIPIDLETICCKAMEKEPQHRYSSAAEFAEDLRRYINNYVIRAKRSGPLDKLAKFVRRNPVTVTLVSIILLGGMIGTVMGWKYYTSRWAQRVAIPQIMDLIERDDYFEALSLAEKAEHYIANDPLLSNLLSQLSRQSSIDSTPAGTRIYIGKYNGGSPEWKYLGLTPLKGVRVPYGTHRWKAERPSFQTIESVRTVPLVQGAAAEHQEDLKIDFLLHREGQFPADMVYVSESSSGVALSVVHGVERAYIPAFLIDKYEVTNRQFKEFIDSGGYEDKKYWTHEFAKDDTLIKWSDAMEEFLDKTGQQGPSTWRKGTYPAGQDAYPVSGISWFEAAAYAEFRGKRLPTVYHWAKCAINDNEASKLTKFSNFSGSPAPVGSYTGMGVLGVYDIAGNVREWCHNAVDGPEQLNYIFGGAWGDMSKVFVEAEAHSPWDREQGNGLRCVRYLDDEEIPAIEFAPIKRKTRDIEHFTPVSDEVFRSYVEDLYVYDRTELNSIIEERNEDQPLWRVEKITYDAAYDNERITAYLYLPKNAEPPYQTVILEPGAGAFQNKPSQTCLSEGQLPFVIKSGRAVLLPIYKATYERSFPTGVPVGDSIAYRDMVVMMSKDLRRSIDYLETRDDIDSEKLAYLGVSWGGGFGPVLMATEARLTTGIFIVGGICGCKRPPQVDPANFAPHVKIPILMINGEHDFIFPYEMSQRTLYNLLGTPTEHKKHIVYPGGHSIAWEYHDQYQKDVVDWLDAYLGRVHRTSENN